MPNDVAAVEFFFAEEDFQKGTFSGSVAADKADFDVIGEGGIGVIEKNLIAVTFDGV